MKKWMEEHPNEYTVIFIIIVVILWLCTACGSAPIKTVDLLEQQTKITSCSTKYIECLDRTKAFKDDFNKFETEIDKCVEKASNCPLRPNRQG